MRRALAILVLSAINSAWIAPLAFADSESSLPACCRKNGAHRCSMGRTEVPSSEIGIRAMRECTECPASTAAQCDDSVALIDHPQTIRGEFAIHFTLPVHSDPLSVAFFSKSHRKRGPPADNA